MTDPLPPKPPHPPIQARKPPHHAMAKRAATLIKRKNIGSAQSRRLARRALKGMQPTAHPTPRIPPG